MKYNEELHERLRELIKSAAPTPWHIEPLERMLVSGENEDIGEEVGAVYYHAGRSKKEKANRALIVEAPNAVDALLDEIERLVEERKTAQSEAWKNGYADCLCDIEAVYEIDREAITHKTTDPYEEQK